MHNSNKHFPSLEDLFYISTNISSERKTRKKVLKRKLKKGKKEQEEVIGREMDAERLAQIQNLKNGGVYATNGDSNFDMVIEHNDSDFGEESSENEASPKKLQVEPTVIEHHFSRSEKKVSKIEEKANQITSHHKSIERSERVSYFDRNGNLELLKHWEEKFGGKEKRKFYTDLEKFKNNWDSEEEEKEPTRLVDSTNMRKIQSTKPKKNDFDYDWDEDHQQDQKYESKKSPEAPKVSKSRVPLGGLPYADAKYNNGYTDPSLEKEFAKAGKNILGQIGT